MPKYTVCYYDQDQQDRYEIKREIIEAATKEAASEIMANCGKEVITAEPTPQSRPLINYPTHFEKNYCHECMTNHFVEIIHTGRIICHGRDYFFEAQHEKTHYSRRQGKGFELVPMNPRQLDWLMAQEAAEPVYSDVDQDW